MSFTMKEGGFGVTDFAVFFVLCISSCAGGIWYSYTSSSRKRVVDIKDYLLGGKTMTTFPVAMSLIASYVSGVTILGTPAEIYNFGTQYWLVVVGVVLSCVVVAVVYLPVFCLLKLSSSYESFFEERITMTIQLIVKLLLFKTALFVIRASRNVIWRITQYYYLELRFNRHVRAVASILFLLDEVLFLPMVIYVPALAFNQLTGFNVYAVGGVMVVICGFYTALGGLRAVVWTDSVQTGVMFLGVVLVAVAGTLAVGGVGAVVSIVQENGRFDLSNWDISPYERQTGWGAVFGGFLYWTCFNSVNQTMVQRYISLPTKRKAVYALAIFSAGAILAISLCAWSGLAAFATWVQGGCDDAAAPAVDDRLLPAFVTYVSKVKNLPGLPGVFLAGVFGAGLSSLSAVLNACALVVVEDIMHGWLQIHLKPLYEGILARLVTAILAVLSVLMLIVIAKLGGVLGVATALSAIAASATCGIFTLGMVCWWVGPRGAIAGGVAGALVAGTTSLGSQAAAAAGLAHPPLSVNSCGGNVTLSSNFTTFDPTTVFPLFRVSYHWIAPLGLASTLIVGAIVGYFLDERDPTKMDAELFTPVIWRWLPEKAHENAGDVRRAVAELTSHRATSSPLLVTRLDKIEMNGQCSR